MSFYLILLFLIINFHIALNKCWIKIKTETSVKHGNLNICFDLHFLPIFHKNDTREMKTSYKFIRNMVTEKEMTVKNLEIYKTQK